MATESPAQSEQQLPGWEGVEVRVSRIAEAGEGLFAARAFAAGEVICEYRGQVLSLAQALRRENKDYLMGLSLNCHVDAREARAVPGRYVNDARCAARQNAEFRKLPKLWKAEVVALRPIQPGEEIYADYGEGYWRARDHSRPPH